MWIIIKVFVVYIKENMMFCLDFLYKKKYKIKEDNNLYEYGLVVVVIWINWFGNIKV